MAILQTGNSWQFGNEFELEEVLWQNLPALLNLQPFKRQYSVRGQFCDILALDDRRRLVVLELKNVEDRYVVQQLTRYYHALKEEAPFSDEVDVSQPIRLMAIAPGFHQDTWHRPYCISS
jgi:RecB family endonuclease NucS